MGNMITNALIFIMVLNALMFLSQLASADMNPEGVVFYNCEGSMIDGFGNCNQSFSYLNTSDTINQLPTAESSVDVSTGNIFTDTFRSIKNWITQSTGLRYVFGMLKAPYNICKSLNLPEAIATTFGVLWYAITLFLIIAFIWGRDV